LLQCGGLWFVNGKVSITWNLKQAIVQKPKETTKGCLLRPNVADKEKLRALPPPEDVVEADDGQVSTQVIDSDDEEAEQPVVPTPTRAAPVPPATPVAAAAAVVDAVAADDTAVEVKPKKKLVVRKKTDA
jgi:hypothetical protein